MSIFCLTKSSPSTTYILPHHTELHFFPSLFNLLSFFLSVCAYLEFDFQWHLLPPSEIRRVFRAPRFFLSCFQCLVMPYQQIIPKIRIPWNTLFFSCTFKQPVHNRLNKAIDHFNLQLAIEKLLIEKNRKYPQQDPHHLTNYLLSKYIKIMQILAGLSVAQHLPASWQHSYKGKVCLTALVIL